MLCHAACAGLKLKGLEPGMINSPHRATTLLSNRKTTPPLSAPLYFSIFRFLFSIFIHAALAMNCGQCFDSQG